MDRNSSIFNSKHFPAGFVWAVVLIVATFVFGSAFLVATDSMPAPSFSGRQSLDEKMRFLRIHRPTGIKMVALGSSTTFNNLASGPIVQKTPIGEAYLNLSTWGMSVSSLPDYWALLSKLFSPEYIIVCGNLEDFNIPAEVQLNHEDILGYIKGGPPLKYYVKYHNQFFVDRLFTMGAQRRRDDRYDTLKLDPYGWAVLNFDEDDIKEESWKRQYDPDGFDVRAYDILENFIKTLNKEGITLIYVVCPTRNHFYGKVNPNFVERHWKRVRKIVEGGGMYFIDMHEALPMKERFFVDYGHLNKEGAIYFTNKLVAEMNSRGIFKQSGRSAVARNAGDPGGGEGI